MNIQKTRYKTLMFSGVFFGLLLFILNGVLCPGNGVQQYCFMDDYADEILQPLLIISISLFIVSIFVFFISNRIFKIWIKFAILWIGLTTIWVSQVPVYSGRFPTVIPEAKEDVSIWMGSLFVIISLGMFAVMTLRERFAKKVR